MLGPAPAAAFWEAAPGAAGSSSSQAGASSASSAGAGSVARGKQPISNEKPAPSCVAPTLEQIKILSKQWQASHAASAGAPATGAAASAVAAKQLSVDEEHLEA